MFETITQESTRTFKEINKYHDMVCIEKVDAIEIREYNGEPIKWVVDFRVNCEIYSSDGFDTEEEAIQFRDEVMGWKNESS